MELNKKQSTYKALLGKWVIIADFWHQKKPMDVMGNGLTSLYVLLFYYSILINQTKSSSCKQPKLSKSFIIVATHPKIQHAVPYRHFLSVIICHE